MFQAIIKKVIARMGEREVIDCSFEEMQDFVIYNHRPEFLDEHVLCVKFILSLDETMEDTEETCWYVNPVYFQSSLQIKNEFIEDETSFDHFPNPYESRREPLEVKIASEFLPELLLLMPEHPEISILEKYSQFRNNVLFSDSEEASDEKLYELFVQWLSKNI